MAVRFGVPIQDAWYAVVDPSSSSVRGLADVLEEFGIDDRRSVGDAGVSLYAFERQGMRANSDGFRAYIRNNIEEALARGAVFR